MYLYLLHTIHIYLHALVFPHAGRSLNGNGSLYNYNTRERRARVSRHAGRTRCGRTRRVLAHLRTQECAVHLQCNHMCSVGAGAA